MARQAPAAHSTRCSASEEELRRREADLVRDICHLLLRARFRLASGEDVEVGRAAGAVPAAPHAAASQYARRNAHAFGLPVSTGWHHFDPSIGQLFHAYDGLTAIAPDFADKARARLLRTARPAAASRARARSCWWCTGAWA